MTAKAKWLAYTAKQVANYYSRASQHIALELAEAALEKAGDLVRPGTALQFQIRMLAMEVVDLRNHHRTAEYSVSGLQDYHLLRRILDARYQQIADLHEQVQKDRAAEANRFAQHQGPDTDPN